MTKLAVSQNCQKFMLNIFSQKNLDAFFRHVERLPLLGGRLEADLGVLLHAVLREVPAAV